MNINKFKAAIRKFYGLNRPVTDDEAQAEYENLARRLHRGSGLTAPDSWLIMSLPMEWHDAIRDDKEYPDAH